MPICRRFRDLGRQGRLIWESVSCSPRHNEDMQGVLHWLAAHSHQARSEGSHTTAAAAVFHKSLKLPPCPLRPPLAPARPPAWRSRLPRLLPLAPALGRSGA